MYIRTIRSAKAILLLSASFALTATTNAASAQSYHHTFKVDSAMLDSVETSHLQVSLHKVENENLKFRLAAFNPASRFMIITIMKGDDVFYTQSVRQDKYEYIFDLSSLEDGNYQLIVSTGKEKISKDILIQTATHVDRVLSVN